MGVIILLFSHPLLAMFSYIKSSFIPSMHRWVLVVAEVLTHYHNTHNKQQYCAGWII